MRSQGMICHLYGRGQKTPTLPGGVALGQVVLEGMYFRERPPFPDLFYDKVMDRRHEIPHRQTGAFGQERS